MRQQLLTADDVAVILRVPRSLVYALARRGELPTVRIGERYVRFRATSIEWWIQSQEGCEAQRLAGLSPTRAARRKRSATSRDAVG
jgi:excisionase family DNA binding protein